MKGRYKRLPEVPPGSNLCRYCGLPVRKRTMEQAIALHNRCAPYYWRHIALDADIYNGEMGRRLDRLADEIRQRIPVKHWNKSMGRDALHKMFPEMEALYDPHS